MKKVFSVLMLFILTFSLAGCGKKASKEDFSAEVSDVKVIESSYLDEPVKSVIANMNVTNNTDMYLTNYPVIIYFTDENDEYVENSLLTDAVSMYPEQTIEMPLSISEQFYDYEENGNVDFDKVSGVVVRTMTFDDISKIYEYMKEQLPNEYDEEPTQDEYDEMIESCKSEEPYSYERNNDYYAYTDSFEISDVNIKDSTAFDDFYSLKLSAKVKNVTDNTVKPGVGSVVVEGSKDGEVVARFSETMHQEDFKSDPIEAGASDTFEIFKVEDQPGILGLDGETYYSPQELTYTITYAPILSLTIGR